MTAHGRADGERGTLRSPVPPCIADLARALEQRAAAGLARVRRTVQAAQGRELAVDGARRIAFASNDYLGLASHEAVVAAAIDGAARFGVGAGASHLISGHMAPHAELEAELAAFVRPCDNAAAVTFSSGYLANLAVLTGLAARGDAVFADRLNHACLNDGALLSRAALVRYPHRDVGALASRVARTEAARRVIATDGVFSMDGTIAPLPELLALADAHDALLLVDDAHAFGVLGRGRGTAAHFDVASPRLVVMGTLGKAAGVAGAFVAAHRVVIETIVQTARPYMFTTAAPPLLANAARASLQLIGEGDERRERLAQLVRVLQNRAARWPWVLMPSTTPIQPLLVGDNDHAAALSRALWDAGFWVPAIRPPTVPKGTARLRISLTAAHTVEDVEQLASALDALAIGVRRTVAA